MTKDVLLMLLGGLVAFLPFLGFPSTWDTILLVVFGICVVLLGVAVRRSGANRSVARSDQSAKEPAASPYAH